MKAWKYYFITLLLPTILIILGILMLINVFIYWYNNPSLSSIELIIEYWHYLFASIVLFIVAGVLISKV